MVKIIGQIRSGLTQVYAMAPLTFVAATLALGQWIRPYAKLNKLVSGGGKKRGRR